MMLRTVYQQLKSVKKWVLNNLNNYEHDVDFIQRVRQENLSMKTANKNMNH